eukprot:TRINITY_DN10572_c0_g1_i1.p1 TRINITY_DN10572_c0_g1~~TRINITY_DN10572_c0_g1_i1.p1  ORF type:complete len:330 (+),score=32.81 TRINITY_DN10572_c0_g1_i1:42-1031(+)
MCIRDRYMGDQKSKREVPKNTTLRKLLEFPVNQAELRDEVFVQICKQLNHNPQIESTFLGWELLLLCLTSFTPSLDLDSHLQKYVEPYKQSQNEKIAAYAKRCQRLLKLQSSGFSKRYTARILSKQEIENARQSPFVQSIYNVSLEELMEFQQSAHPTLDVPYILVALIDAFKKRGGFATQGVFRISADAQRMRQFQSAMEKSEGIALGFDIGTASPHDFACLLKDWLKRLATPIFPIPIYDKVIAEYEKLGIDGITGLMPEINAKVLRFIVAFLKDLSRPANAAKTKMGAHNLALIFSPLLLQCQSKDPMVLLANTKSESQLLMHLLK